MAVCIRLVIEITIFVTGRPMNKMTRGCVWVCVQTCIMIITTDEYKTIMGERRCEEQLSEENRVLCSGNQATKKNSVQSKT